MVRVLRYGVYLGVASALFSLSALVGAGERESPEAEGPLLVFHVGSDRRLTIETGNEALNKPLPDPATCTVFADPCPGDYKSGGMIANIDGFRIGSGGAGLAENSANLWVQSESARLRDTQVPAGWEAQQPKRVGTMWRIDIELEKAEVPLPGDPDKGCWVEVQCPEPETPLLKSLGVQR